MHPDKIKLVKGRLESVLSALRLQNSGADIHTVGNIRNTAQLLIEQLEDDPDCIGDELADQILKNTEAKLVEFYQNKYPSFRRCKKHPEGGPSSTS